MLAFSLKLLNEDERLVSEDANSFSEEDGFRSSLNPLFLFALLTPVPNYGMPCC